jgi:hypothetical protein
LYFISPEGRQLVAELLAIILFIPVLRIIIGVITILSLFDIFDRKK